MTSWWRLRSVFSIWAPDLTSKGNPRFVNCSSKSTFRFHDLIFLNTKTLTSDFGPAAPNWIELVELCPTRPGGISDLVGRQPKNAQDTIASRKMLDRWSIWLLMEVRTFFIDFRQINNRSSHDRHSADAFVQSISYGTKSLI